jgi:hypothetical protein
MTEQQGPQLETRRDVGVAYLRNEELLLLSVPLELIDELCEQLGTGSDLSKVIKAQVAGSDIRKLDA